MYGLKYNFWNLKNQIDTIQNFIDQKCIFHFN